MFPFRLTRIHLSPFLRRAGFFTMTEHNPMRPASSVPVPSNAEEDVAMSHPFAVDLPETIQIRRQLVSQVLWAGQL